LLESQAVGLMRAVLFARNTPSLESVDVSNNNLSADFGEQVISMMVETIEQAKSEAMEIVRAAGNLASRDL
jgi:hypothetical protein